jgi:hypothetical protein
MRYEFVTTKSAIKTTTLLKPAHYNDLQWSGLLVTNHFRSHVGLAPVELDAERCDGCQKHAQYLLLNNYDYSKPWDGIGSHDEIPGNPGYTKEGHDASHRHGTSGTGDAAGAIVGQTRTMLHREGYIGAVSSGLGIGAVNECQNSSATGYSVTGGGGPNVSSIDEIIVVPAPGQRGVYPYCKRERPRPDRDPAFYETTRGYPISVSFGSLDITETTIEVFTGKRGRLRPVKGFLFSPEKPISKTRPRNSNTTFFVAAGGLDRKTAYTVRFRAKKDGEPFELAWEFATQ